MGNISGQNCRENHIYFTKQFFFRKSYLFCYNVKKSGRARQAPDDHIVESMPIACWIPKVKNKHSEYVKIIDFAQQQSLHERSLMLRYTYSVCLLTPVNITSIFHT